MIKEELLSKLYFEHTGENPEHLTVLPKSGSDRIYLRMEKWQSSILGVWNPNRKENDAFTGFARHFREIGLRVPEVIIYLPEEMVYLAQDLGDLDLVTWVHEKGGTSDGIKSVEEMYQSVLRELIKFQFEADKGLDYNLCYPRKRFDRSSVMWDLYYFKYMFLKLSGTSFNEQLLEDDFFKMAEKIESVKTEGFLYRDFQSRNIMIKDGEPWFIDFQGGRKGAPHYDLASLLLDPYVELEKPLHDRLLEYYCDLLKDGFYNGKDTFRNEYKVFGIVRLLQALGAYGFRGLYERKPNFTDSIPAAVRQLSRIFESEELRNDLPELSRIISSLYIKWGHWDLEVRKKTNIIIESFSFNKGIPETFLAEGGFMFDCRYISDPSEDEELKTLNGKHKKVVEYFEGKKDIQGMIENAFHLISGSLESSGIGKTSSIRVCFGCVTGRRRSVYCADMLSSMLKGKKNVEVLLFHHEIR
jgi:aminoglycoside/choline kinase family phosphotransferase